MKRSTFSKLIRKYQSGLLGKKEEARMDDWFDSFSSPSEGWSSEEVESLKTKIFDVLENDPMVEPKENRGLKKWYGVAAALVVISLSVSLFIYLNATNGNQHEPTKMANVILPGGNKAILKTQEGLEIQLSSDQIGIMVRDDQFVYEDGTDLGIEVAKKQQQLSLETQRGGQYQVTLSDGTKVFLNAESKLSYPSQFEGDRRIVRLEGEAYFEVKPLLKGAPGSREKVPFIVEMAGQQVEVLGTAFNLNDYSADGSITTTLVEGKVRVSFTDKGKTSSSFILSPGEQSIIVDGKAKVHPINVEDALAWTKGNFMFSDEKIESVMLKLARWYDAEVIYENELKDIRIWATLSRSQHIQEVLDIIELTSLVKFEVKGRRVYVRKL